MPSGLSESPGGWGSTAGGYGGGGGNTNFGSYTEDDGQGGYNTINVSDYGMSPNDSGYGYNPNYGGSSGGFGGGMADWWGGLGSSYETPSAPQSNFTLQDTFAPVVDSKPSWTGRFDAEAPGGLPDAAPGEAAPQESFWDSELGRNLKKVGLFAAQFNPVTRGLTSLYGAYDALQKGQFGQAAANAIGGLGGNGLVAGLTGLGIDAARGQVNPGQAGSFLGGQLGGRIGAGMGPLGGLIGSEAGSYLGRTIGNANTIGGGQMSYGGAGGQNFLLPQDFNNAQLPKDGASFVPEGLGGSLGQIGQGQGQAQGQGGNWFGPTVGGLASLYLLNQSRGDAKGNIAAMQNMQNNFAAQMAQAQANMPKPMMARGRAPNFAGIDAKLNRMFGKDSEAAQQLRATLERKDAAAGRRSQYGPREVQLLSELTRLRAQAEPGYMNAEIAAANAANSMAQFNAGAHNQFALGNWSNNLNNQRQNAQSQLQLLQAQQADQGRNRQQQQQLFNVLYGMGKETGLFNWAQNGLSNMWSNYAS
jgi:hypothetical protein